MILLVLKKMHFNEGTMLFFTFSSFIYSLSFIINSVSNNVDMTEHWLTQHMARETKVTNNAKGEGIFNNLFINLRLNCFSEKSQIINGYKKKMVQSKCYCTSNAGAHL